MLISTRRQITYPNPDRSDTADVPRDIGALVTASEQEVIYGQGTLAARPTSSVGTPGVQGRVYFATDQSPMTLYYDYGTGWQSVGAVAAGSIGTTQLADDSITGGALGAGVKIKQGTITHDNLVAGTVRGSTAGGAQQEISQGTIQPEDISTRLKPSAGAGAATESLRALGTAAGTAAAGSHQSQHVAAGADALPWTTIHGSGTLAARPTAATGNSGYRYYATDVQGGTEYQSNGASWTQIGAPRLPAGCRLTHSVDQNIPNTDVLTLLSFDTELYDNGGCHDPVANNSRITCPTGEDGLWSFHFMHVYPGTPTKFRVAFRKNGTDFPAEEYWSGGGDIGGTVSALIYLAAGNYVEVLAAQVSGSNPYPIKALTPSGQTESPVFAGAHVA